MRRDRGRCGSSRTTTKRDRAGPKGIMGLTDNGQDGGRVSFVGFAMGVLARTLDLAPFNRKDENEKKTRDGHGYTMLVLFGERFCYN